MGSNIIEKILGRAAGGKTVKPGEIAFCRSDMVLICDLDITIEGSWHRPKKVCDPDRVALVYDHAAPSPSIKDAAGMAEGRRFVEEFGIKHFADIGSNGIIHVVALERGLVLPGELLVSTDSHTCAAGALNCAGRGVSAHDMLQAVTKGTIWYQVSPTVRYEFKGSLPPYVSGKDIFFHIAQTYGSHNGTNVEFGGRGISAIPLSDRRTITTMCAEISADFAIFEYDQETDNFLRGKGDRPYTSVMPDADAEYADVRTIDLSKLEPYVIFPDFVPNNGKLLSQLAGSIRIDQAFIGSCANGKIEDLRVAASIVKGRKIAKNVRLLVTPGSQKIYLQAAREGIIETLVEAGAVVTNATCGACFGYHMGVLAPGEVCITASTRNFKGRMGSADARIYLGSPATVAASAVTGFITDPRNVTAIS